MKKRLLRIIIILVSILSIYGIINILILNYNYKQFYIISKSKEESISYEEVIYKWLEKQFISLENLCEKENIEVPDSIIQNNENIDDIKILCIEISINNSSNGNFKTYPYFFHLEYGAWENSIQSDLYFILNNTDIYEINISSNESKKIILPILISKNDIGNKKWTDVEKDKLNLVFTVYPIKRYFVI